RLSLTLAALTRELWAVPEAGCSPIKLRWGSGSQSTSDGTSTGVTLAYLRNPDLSNYSRLGFSDIPYRLHVGSLQEFGRSFIQLIGAPQVFEAREQIFGAKATLLSSA